MKKIFIACAALMLLSSVAMAQVTTTWNFDDGTLQGWQTGSRNTSVVPEIAVNGYTSTNGVRVQGSRDSNWGTWAYYNLANATNSFTYEATVRYADLRGLWNCGIAYEAVGATGATGYLQGYGKDNTQDRDKLEFKDTKAVSTATDRWDDAFRIDPDGTAGPSTSGTFNEGPATVKMKIDYNNAVSGTGRIMISFQSLDYCSVLTGGTVGVSGNPWSALYSKTIGTDALTGTYYAIDTLRFGGDYSHTDSNFDNISFTDYTVPEPGSIVALGAGMVGMAGFAIRRRK